MPTNWMNNDGLYIKYGTNESIVATGGENNLAGNPVHVYEFDLDLRRVGATGSEFFLSDTVTIPVGAMVERMEIIVREVSAGTNSNLNLGLMKLNRTTPIDLDGYLVAYDEFHLAAIGTRFIVEQGSVEHGALIGEVNTAANGPGLIVAWWDTGAFTDGVITIRIHWVMTTTAITVGLEP